MVISNRSSWTMPILRLGMGLFIAAWGIDKLLATQGSVGIFAHFYGVDVGAMAIRAIGIAEIVLGLAIVVGLLRVFTAWAQLLVNGISTIASWKQIIDPWGVFGLTDGGAHLFLASIAITAMSIVLVLNARDDTRTLDRRLRRNAGPTPADAAPAPAGPGSMA